MASGIYKIECVTSGSFYIGSAVNIKRRWKAHRHALRYGRKPPPRLYNAWHKYGEGAFKFSIVEACAEEKLLEREQYYIDTLKPRYNTRQVAESNLGVQWSEETNAKKGRTRKTFTVRGVTGSLRELTEHFGVVPKDTARWRMYRGWSPEEAFLTPVMAKTEIGKKSAVVKNHSASGRHETAFGVTANLTDLWRQFGVTSQTAFKRRVQLGWDLERALTEPCTR